MRLIDAYPLVTTPHMAAARDFHIRHFGFRIAFEANWFVYLLGRGESGERAPSLAFMHPDHPSRPPGPEAFDGLGMILTFQVADAETAHRALVASGAPIVHPLADEEWGQRRFMTRDPAGLLIDIVEQIEPAPGYWDRYPPRA